MTTRRPNLFLIGAMKAGTTYLRKLLNAHPDIFMCEPDEPSYFVDPRQLRRLYPEMWERGLWRSEDRYLELFRPGGNAAILGEASTSYTKLPIAPGRRTGSPHSTPTHASFMCFGTRSSARSAIIGTWFVTTPSTGRSTKRSGAMRNSLRSATMRCSSGRTWSGLAVTGLRC